MIFTCLAVISLVFAVIPALVFARNLSVYHRAPKIDSVLRRDELPNVSVLIPARNEQAKIEQTLLAVTACQEVEMEVVVLNDHSEDLTAAIVARLASQDSRIRLAEGRPLPDGWCGKQHACAQLAELANNELLMFVDADVRLSIDAIPRIVAMYESTETDLLSGFPRQRTHTMLEHLLIPLIHFILLGFLSLRRMRTSTHPVYGAGCGQLFVTFRTAYQRAGGHAAIRSSLHDGLKLPRQYRRHGLSTDVFDATDVATVRMYESAGQVLEGVGKNATEGVANWRMIVPVTLLLFFGQILPPLLLLLAAVERPAPIVGVLVAVLASLQGYVPRLAGMWRFHDSLWSVLLHPVAMTLFLAIQWKAFLASALSRQQVTWKGRAYPAS